MKQWIATAVVACVLFGPAGVEAAEKFQKLSGTQIQAKLAGMEVSDDVHWRDRYERNGGLTSQSMGRKRTGRPWLGPQVARCCTQPIDKRSKDFRPR